MNIAFILNKRTRLKSQTIKVCGGSGVVRTSLFKTCLCGFPLLLLPCPSPKAKNVE